MTENQTPSSAHEARPPQKPDPAVDRTYRYLLQMRDIDNQLMWTRSNILLLVQGGLLAILASNFDVLADKHIIALAALSLFGLSIAYFWWRITKGGSFWVDYWEVKLGSIEDQVTGTVEIFRNHPSRERDTKKRLAFRREGYISIRKTLVIVTFVMLILWGVLFLYTLIWPFMQGTTQSSHPANCTQFTSSNHGFTSGRSNRAKGLVSVCFNGIVKKTADESVKKSLWGNNSCPLNSVILSAGT